MHQVLYRDWCIWWKRAACYWAYHSDCYWIEVRFNHRSIHVHLRRIRLFKLLDNHTGGTISCLAPSPLLQLLAHVRGPPAGSVGWSIASAVSRCGMMATACLSTQLSRRRRVWVYTGFLLERVSGWFFTRSKCVVTSLGHPAQQPTPVVRSL